MRRELGRQLPQLLQVAQRLCATLRIARAERGRDELLERDGTYVVEDQSSLNGTFVNRKRIESATLQEGDEVQIGKYRMTFIA